MSMRRRSGEVVGTDTLRNKVHGDLNLDKKWLLLSGRRKGMCAEGKRFIH